MMARRWRILGVATGLVLALGGPVFGCGQARSAATHANASTNAQLNFRVLEAGALSQVTRQVEQAFRTAPEWQAFYQGHAPGSVAPAVDFSREVAVAIVQPHNTGGYALVVDSVTESAQAVVVTYTEEAPSPDSVVIQVLTQPHVFVAIPRRDKPIVFERRVTIISP